MLDAELFKFLKDLSKNNNKDWFNANKKRYESSVQAPVLEFVRAMSPRLKGISPRLVADDRKQGGSMMRIYRDVRFSKDKRPYNEQISLRFLHEKPGGLGYYMGIEPGKVTLGAGIWRPEPPQLEKIRKAIAADAAVWVKAFRLKGWVPGGETLKRPPKGFDADHPAVEDLKRKDFVLFTDLRPEDARKPGFADSVAAEYSRAKPMMKFLAAALKLPL
jgi:uncharacterized protein (TIGR02453 family)